MTGEEIVARILPAGVALIMLGLGLGLQAEDFRRVLRVPRAIGVGLFVQVVLLPAAAYLLARAAGLEAAWGIGLLLLAASPGGATACIFSHLAGGDVALNLTLTAVNSLLSAFTIPLMVQLSFTLFGLHGEQVGLQMSKVVEVVFILFGPVLAGMLVRQRRPRFAAAMDKPTRLISVLLLVVLIVGATVRERERLWLGWQNLGGVVVAFNLLSLAGGYLISRVSRLDFRQSVAIALEVGIHNSAVAMTIAITVLKNTAYAMPAALYSIVMFITAGGLTFGIRLGSPGGASSGTPDGARGSASKTAGKSPQTETG